MPDDPVYQGIVRDLERITTKLLTVDWLLREQEGIRAKLAEIEARMEAIQARLREMNERLDQLQGKFRDHEMWTVKTTSVLESMKDLMKSIVTQDQFWAVRTIVYGAVALALGSVGSALLFLVVRASGMVK